MKFDQLLMDEFPIVAGHLVRKIDAIPKHRSLSKDWEFSARANFHIHPGNAMIMASIELRVPAKAHPLGKDSRPFRHSIDPELFEFPSIFLHLSYGCLDAQIENVSLSISPEDISGKLIANGLAGPIIC